MVNNAMYDQAWRHGNHRDSSDLVRFSHSLHEHRFPVDQCWQHAVPYDFNPDASLCIQYPLPNLTQRSDVNVGTHRNHTVDRALAQTRDGAVVGNVHGPQHRVHLPGMH